jgi:hypothetical protein
MSLTSYIAGQVFNTSIMDDLSTGSESDYSTSCVQKSEGEGAC